MMHLFPIQLARWRQTKDLFLAISVSSYIGLTLGYFYCEATSNNLLSFIVFGDR